MPATPMLGDLELSLVQTIQVDEDQVVQQHAVPALEGDFLQRLGRRAHRIELRGVLIGTKVRQALEKLRTKYRAAEPVSFVADIATATKVERVLIEELGVRELAGTPERYAYAFALREYRSPAKPANPPPASPTPPPPAVDTGELVVEARVEGQPGFDLVHATATVQGTSADGPLARTLTHRGGSTWTETGLPPAQLTVTVTEPTAGGGMASGAIHPGQTTRLRVSLRAEIMVARAFVVHFRFDRAFVEPAMLAVLARAGAYATAHSDERLLLVGHTDLTGDGDYNQSLSERRARAVYAALTADADEWARLARPATGALPSTSDSWGTREDQYMLQALGLYRANVDGVEGGETRTAVAAYRTRQGLPSGATIDDQVRRALIADYLGAGVAACSPDRLLDNCPGEPLRWLGCGEQDPIKNTVDAWRPNRRVELLFVRACALPCPVAHPVTIGLPAPGLGWCVPEGERDRRACFVTRAGGGEGAAGTAGAGLGARAGGPEAAPANPWPVQPAEPGTITPSGSISLADGSPARVRYVLTAPDGEYMDGEVAAGPGHGLPIAGVTDETGRFSYEPKPKGVGIYTLSVLGPYVAHNAGADPASATGNEVYRHLDGASPFDVVVTPRGTSG